jgi:AAA domain
MYAGDWDDVYGDTERVEPDLPLAYADPAAERHLLARILFAPDELAAARATLGDGGAAMRADDLRTLYQSVCRLADGHAVIEAQSVVDDLSEQGQLGAAGGPSAVYHLMGLVPPYPAAHYAQRVAAVWPTRRALEDATALNVQLAKRLTVGDPVGALTYARDVATNALDDIAQSANAGRFTEDDWSTVWTLPATEPLVEGLYTMGSTAVVWAPWGAGKTAVEMDMGFHVALDWPWRTYNVTAGHVWYVFGEGQAFIGERLRALCRRYGLDAVPARFHTISQDVPNLLRAGEAEALAGRIRAQTPAGERVMLVQLDTLAATSAGNREDNTDMSSYVAAMKRLGACLPDDRPHVRAAHHPGWNGEHSRGGSSLPGGIDTEVKIGRNADGLCVVECVKQRGGGYAPFAAFGYRVVAQTIDEAGHTGPVVEWVELPSEVAASLRAGRNGAMPPKVAEVWRIFGQILAEYAHSGNGVFWGTWKERAVAAGIAEGTFKSAVKWLRDRGYVHQPDTTQAYYPIS